MTLTSYYITIDGNEIFEDEGSLSLTLGSGGQNSFSFDVTSLDGSYRPSLDDEVIFVINGATSSTSLSNTVGTKVLTTQASLGWIVVGKRVRITAEPTAVHGSWMEGEVTAYTGTSLTVEVDTVHGATVTQADWSVGIRLIAGTITRTTEHGISDLFTPITTAVDVSDFNALAGRVYVKTVLAAGTMKSRLQALVTNYLSALGVTLDPDQVDGPAVIELPADYRSVGQVLDDTTAETTYTARIDAYKVLSAKLPSADAAPVALSIGNGVAIDDIGVSISRTTYANRVVVRFSNVARNAWAFLVSDGTNFIAGETVTIGGKTYTYTSPLGSNDGDVLVGATTALSITYLAAAIRRVGGAGSTYAEATTEHTSVSAWETAGHDGLWLTVRAKEPGLGGNSIDTTETCAHAGFIWEGAGATTTLLGGEDQALTNVAIAEDAGEIALYGVYETLVERPDITVEAVAQSVASSLVASLVLSPSRTVNYSTRAIGFFPGQSQSITAAARGLSGTFSLTEVRVENDEWRSLRFDVTAVESSSVKAATEPRSTYQLWSGKAAAPAFVGGGTGGAGTGGGGRSYPLGGGMVSDGTPTWKDAANARIKIYGSGTSVNVHVVVTLFAVDAGIGVTARLYDLDAAAPVSPTSAQVTSTTPTIAEFDAALVGGHRYKLQVLPSAANKRVAAEGYVLEV